MFVQTPTAIPPEPGWSFQVVSYRHSSHSHPLFLHLVFFSDQIVCEDINTHVYSQECWGIIISRKWMWRRATQPNTGNACPQKSSWDVWMMWLGEKDTEGPLLSASYQGGAAFQTPRPWDDTAGLPSLLTPIVRRKKEILFSNFNVCISKLLSHGDQHSTSLALSLIAAPDTLLWFPGDTPGLHSEGLLSACPGDATLCRPFKPSSEQLFSLLVEKSEFVISAALLDGGDEHNDPLHLCI